MEQHLDFEQPIYTCLEKIEELKKIIPEPENLHEEIAILEKQSKKETERIYSSLSPWQKVLVARHPNRPHTIDYLANVFDGFEEIHGDRLGDDDRAIIGGRLLLLCHHHPIYHHVFPQTHQRHLPDNQWYAVCLDGVRQALFAMETKNYRFVLFLSLIAFLK